MQGINMEPWEIGARATINPHLITDQRDTNKSSATDFDYYILFLFCFINYYFFC